MYRYGYSLRSTPFFKKLLFPRYHSNFCPLTGVWRYSSVNRITKYIKAGFEARQAPLIADVRWPSIICSAQPRVTRTTKNSGGERRSLTGHSPLFVAKTTIGERLDSRALLRNVKHSMSSMCTSSMKSTPGMSSATPCSMYLLTTCNSPMCRECWMQGYRWSEPLLACIPKACVCVKIIRALEMMHAY